MKGWLIFGFFGQALFFMRFFIQWLASERRKESVIPIYFWYFSLGGGAILLTYAIHLRDPVCTLLDKRIEKTEPVGVYRNLYQGAYNFYLGRNHLAFLQTPGEARRFLSEPGHPVLILTEQELSRIEQEGETSYRVLVRGRFENHMMVAVTSNPPSEK